MPKVCLLLSRLEQDKLIFYQHKMGDNIIIEMIGEIKLRRIHHDSENYVFSTPNKYLNNKIYNRLIPHPGTTFLVSRYFLVANQLISLELYDNSLYISMKYGVIMTKYRYVTEELILHMISVGKVPPSHECSYIHSIPGEDIEMEFDTRSCSIECRYTVSH